MDNCWTCLKKLLCCSHDGTTAGVHQGHQNPQSRSPDASSFALAVLPPAYPEEAVGLEKPLEELKEKLELQSKEVPSRVVVIYGVGGIGKTTLANALVASLAEDLKEHIYIKIEINQESLINDFESTQPHILRHSSPSYHGRGKYVTNRKDGLAFLKDSWNYYSPRPVFLFIDNALQSKDLIKLLRQRFPQGTRILVTTRNLSTTDWFEGLRIPRHTYYVSPLAEEDALKILCNNPTHLDQIRNRVEKIARILGGIPLLLKIVGACLRKQNYKVEYCSHLLQALEYRGDVEEENLSERLVHFVYNDLKPSNQKAFLDICSIFNGLSRRLVEYIVGVEEVKLLAEAALITSLPIVNAIGPDSNDLRTKYWAGEGLAWAGEEVVIVHDVIVAEGRQIAERTLISDLDSWSRAAQDQVQAIERVVLFSHQKREIQLDCINNSLRLFILGARISVSAGINHAFQNLRYLRLDGDIPCLPMNSEELHYLSVYEGPIFEELLAKLPQNLKYLRPQGGSSLNAKSIQAVQNFSLEELNLAMRENMREMLDGRFHFDALKILSLEGWKEMEELPPQVCRLPSLNKLILRECFKLKGIPESIANLRALTHMDLSCCNALTEVCSSLGELMALRYLDLSDCKSLRKLPDNFGQLSALEYLSLLQDHNLKLPETFAQLRSLKGLDLRGCTFLKFPSNVAQLPSLEALWVSRRVMEGFGLFHEINGKLKIIYGDDYQFLKPESYW